LNVLFLDHRQLFCFHFPPVQSQCPSTSRRTLSIISSGAWLVSCACISHPKSSGGALNLPGQAFPVNPQTGRRIERFGNFLQPLAELALLRLALFCRALSSPLHFSKNTLSILPAKMPRWLTLWKLSAHGQPPLLLFFSRLQHCVRAIRQVLQGLAGSPPRPLITLKCFINPF